ncbi:MAG TPA: UvrD-helicase domain-containing protein [Streptosporangiaceae bacterium]
MEPTGEQRQARDVFAAGGDLAVVAGAGTGKTSTLMLMAAATRRRGLYLAFNRATAEDARRRFGPNVQCRTAHSLAYRAVGARYRDRLNSAARIPSAQVARILGIRRPLTVGRVTISEAHQARLVLGMVRRFCFSSDTEIKASHLDSLNGLSPGELDYVAGALIRSGWNAWDDLRAPAGRLRFEHDHYLKIWALGHPVLPGDFVLLDEAQDTNPVLEEIFLAQGAQRVCVGDPAQQIYAWRAARDVMTGFAGDHVQLTRSFRFGPAIADVANRWLGYAASELRLTGAGPADSTVRAAADAAIPGNSANSTSRADAVLCRSNADVMKEVLGFLDDGVRVAITGGGEALRRIAEAAQELKSGRRTSHPELFLFPSWGAVQEYAENDEAAQDLKTLVGLVDEHGPETVIAAVGRLSPEDDAEVTVSTAHKAKGREWEGVRIGPGFGVPIAEPGEQQRRLSLEEARLIYVAVSRARRELDVTGLEWADAYEKAITPPGGPLWRPVTRRESS